MSNLIMFGNKKHDYYKGLLIRADQGLHEQIANEVTSLLPKNAKILDFGCGQGALSLRLKDLGFDVLAVDINEQDFKAKEVTYKVCNFNSSEAINDFVQAHEGIFDCVLGIEVIEHVENPWDYLRTLQKLVKKNGYILVSTPNTTSWYSRAVYFMTGMFPGFVDPDESGHINPISEWEIKVISSKIGLNYTKALPAGSLPYIWINKSLIKTALNLLFLPLFPFMKGELRGWCKLFVLKKE